VTLTVKQRAEIIGTFRYIHVALMETLARWTPTTPEMEVKVLFGRDIWECAQQADALGKRTHELRAPLQYSQKPSPAYLDFLAQLAGVQPTAERLAAFYDVALPALARRYEQFLAATDHLLDAPSVKVVRRILGDFEEMRRGADQLRRELPDLRSASSLDALRAAEGAESSTIVVHAPAPAPREATA
jgi:hypothetical protein